MIWAIVSKEEMEGFGTSPVFRFYREVLGKDNIRLAVVEENDELDFVGLDDVILLRTASKSLLQTIERKHIKSTAERFEAYEIIKDKAGLAVFLQDKEIQVPRQFSIDDVEDGKTYFVKPRFGSDSFGITIHNICKTKADVKFQVMRLKELGYESVIEEFIEGMDCTVACCCPYEGEILTAAIEVECEETEGIQTRDCKVGFKECCSAVEDSEELESVAKEVFNALGLDHHARIDFRRDKDGNVYVIDVNLLPGLGPIDHFAKCFLLAKNFSYADTMKMLVVSALI